MRSLLIILIIAAALVALSCASDKPPASPVETFKTYTKASKQKDITTMKLLLSAATIKMHEQEAKAQNLTVDDIVKRETLFTEGQTKVEFRNEKIEGEKATLEVKNSFGSWEIIPFVFEAGEWKIDKKGFAEQLEMDIQQDEQRMNDAINQDRVPQ